MGIPSYYKKLITQLPTLVSPRHPDGAITWLFMDFNCLIYHCLPRAPAYPCEEWESQFLDCIVSYARKVIRDVSPTIGVVIAIDGVVPMAKMRQQRLRRFKSVWMGQHPELSEAESTGPKWDTNAITPGTVFMGKLRIALEQMIERHGKHSWILSSSDQPGEGEHKIMAEWRKGTYQGNFAVYGLDADLIVLSLLGQTTLKNRIWLFREEIDKGKMVYDAGGEEKFEWFSIHTLAEWLTQASPDKDMFLMNYCFAMSVLGNDFLPSSLGLKMRDDGHAELLDQLQKILSRGQYLIGADGAISNEGLLAFFQIFAVGEADRVSKYIFKKRMMARRGDTRDLPVGHSDWPLTEIAEEAILDSYDRAKLAQNWQTQYQFHFFPSWRTKQSRDSICDSYLYGIQWIWAYYTGAPVCYNWYYPHALPPLWEWLTAHLPTGLPAFPHQILFQAADIRPVQQLALVLPLESWSLIPSCQEKQFATKAPWFFPKVFEFESVGKRFFWECEAQIPIPSLVELTSLIHG